MKEVGYRTFELNESSDEFHVTQTKAGWAVQNSLTYHIVIIYETKTQADTCCLKLNGKSLSSVMFKQE